MHQQQQHIGTQPQEDTAIYTLEPLRLEGPDALRTEGIAGIQRITLVEIEIDWQNAAHEVTILRADDLFQRTCDHGAPDDTVPAKGKISRATFECELESPRHLERFSIRPPNIISLDPADDPKPIKSWLEKLRFRIPKVLAATLLSITAIMFVPDLEPDSDDNPDMKVCYG